MSDVVYSGIRGCAALVKSGMGPRLYGRRIVMWPGDLLAAADRRIIIMSVCVRMCVCVCVMAVAVIFFYDL